MARLYFDDPMSLRYNKYLLFNTVSNTCTETHERTP